MKNPLASSWAPTRSNKNTTANAGTTNPPAITGTTVSPSVRAILGTLYGPLQVALLEHDDDAFILSLSEMRYCVHEASSNGYALRTLNRVLAFCDGRTAARIEMLISPSDTTVSQEESISVVPSAPPPSPERASASFNEDMWRLTLSPDDVPLPQASSTLRDPDPVVPYFDERGIKRFGKRLYLRPEPKVKNTTFPEWDMPVGPHTRRSASPPIPRKGTLYKDVCDLEVLDLDNKSTMKRIASYKLKVPTKAPKEKREANVKKMRDAKIAMRDPWRGSYNDRSQYEAQMNLNFNVTHGLNTETRTILENISTHFSASMQNMGDNISSFGSDVRATIGDLESNIAAGADQTFRSLVRMLWAIPLVGACYYYLSTVEASSFKHVLLGFTGLLSVILPGGMWDAIKPLWPTEAQGGLVAQSFILQPNIIANVLTLGLTFLTLGSTDKMGIAKGFVRSMPQYSRSVTGWQDLMTFVISLIESFVNYIRGIFGYDKLAIHQTAYDDVNAWCARVMDVVNESQTGGDIMTPETIEMLAALRRQGTDLTHMYRTTREVSPLLHKYLAYLDNLCSTCSAAMHISKGGRSPPVVLALRGDPGVGKTWLTKYIMTYLLSSIISDERASALGDNLDGQVYQKPSSEYWNGYCGQPAVIIDDFAQSIPKPGVENDYIDLIRMNSSWAYPLNFADLENKGKNFFCSKIILLTTNLENIDSCNSVIMEPAAITRRIDFGFTLTVAKDFQTDDGKIDISKVNEYAVVHDEFPYHAWVLQKHVFALRADSYTDRSKTYDLREVLDLVSARIKSNEMFYENNNNMMKKMLRRKYESDAAQAAKEKRVAQCGFSWGPGFDNEPTHQPKTLEKMADVVHPLHATKIVLNNDNLMRIMLRRKYESDAAQATKEKYVAQCGFSWDSDSDDEPVHQPKILEKMVDAVYPPHVAKIVRQATDGIGEITRVFCRDFKIAWDDYWLWIRAVVSMPLVRAFLTAYFSVCAVLMLSQISRSIIDWFMKPKDNAFGDELRKKKDVPDECLAQMMSTFRPSDFRTVEEKDGKYVSVYKFTRDTLLKAYERLGAFVPQSNEPSGPRFIYRKIDGARVVESDVVAQADVYGDDIAKVAYKNLFQVRVSNDGDERLVGHVLAVRGNCFLVPTHYDLEFKKALQTRALDESSKITVFNAINKNLTFTITLGEFLSFRRCAIPDLDVSMVEFARPMMCLRDITDKFISSGDIRSMRDVRVRLDTVEGTDFLIHRSRHVAAWRKDGAPVSSKGGSYVLSSCYEYTAYTDYGDCGGLVMLEEDSSKQSRRIVGIHVAGEPSIGIGLCSILTQEKIEAALNSFKVIKDVEVVSQCGIATNKPIVDGSFMPLFKCTQAHNTNPVSCYVPTPLHGLWGDCGKIPAPLRPFKGPDGVKINPMRNALESYASPVLLYDSTKVKRACYQAFAPTRSLTKDDSREIFSFEEAVAGRPGTDINGIPRGTSPGFPYILDKITNKKVFFGKDEDYVFDSDMCIKLRARVESIIEKAAKGERSFHVFTDFLKDEPRKREKALKGMSRLISSAPLDLTVAFRMYFLSFTVAVQRTRIRNGVAVGINPYTEWNYLARQMQSKGPDCVAGDFKGFDSSEQPDIHWAILDEINDWYDDGPVNALIRRVLWCEVVHSRHLGGLSSMLDDIYQWNHSLPSGHPMTSIINSYYNLTLFNMAWYDVMGPEYTHRFWEFVYICVYGDDNILNISRAVSWKYNQESIGNAMSKYGMVYTSENKDDCIAKVRTLGEISFLKRSFLFNDHLHQFVGPQDLESILFIPYWCKNKAMMKEITIANVEFTYMELALHPKEVWDAHASVIRRTVKEVMREESQQMFDQTEYLMLSQVSTMVWPL